MHRLVTGLPPLLLLTSCGDSGTPTLVGASRSNRYRAFQGKIG